MTASSPFQALLPALDAFSRAKPGQRLDLPPVAGSGDALAIARLAGGKRMLVVVTANPIDAQRLSDEIAWLAPGLRTHLLPDWETLPYDSFSPPFGVDTKVRKVIGDSLKHMEKSMAKEGGR